MPMPTPPEKLPPLESQFLRILIWQRPISHEMHLSAQTRFADLGELGPCETVTDAEPPHNPVLTLNTAADYSRESKRKRSSSFLRSCTFTRGCLFVLDSGVSLTPIA